MYETGVIVALWGAFAVTHMALSSVRLRPRLVAALGERAFQGVYSLVALAIFVPLVWFYFAHKHAGGLLWVIPVSDVLRWVLYIGNGLAFILVVGGLVTPSPAVMGITRSEPRGVHFLTRHALFMGIGIWALLHLISNGYAADVAFFAGFPVFVLLGSWHQDRRKLATQAEFRGFYDQTPFVPFTGRQTLRGLRELSPLAWVIGVGLTVLLRVYHGPLFGP